MGKHLLGKTAAGTTIEVIIDLAVQPGEHTTVTHETATDPQRLSIVGNEKHYGSTLAGGQIVDSLDKVTEPADGWTLEAIADLKALWTEWHLNDMQAGCTHVPEPVWEYEPYKRPNLKDTAPCPETGYRYGVAWLVKPLTPEALAEAARLDALP